MERKNMNGEVKDFSQVINSLFENISPQKAKEALTINNEWNKVLGRIKSAANPYEGRNIADHTRVIDLKNGMLLVESDHPGWTSLVQMHKNFILKGIKMDFPDLKINNIAIYLKGKYDPLKENGAESYSVEKMKNVIEEKAKKDEEEIENYMKRAGNNKKTEKKAPKSLPPEIEAIFNNILGNQPLTN